MVQVEPLEEVVEERDERHIMSMSKAANLTGTGIDFRRQIHDSRDFDMTIVAPEDLGGHRRHDQDKVEEEKCEALEIPRRSPLNNSLPDLHQNENSLSKQRPLKDYRKIHSSYEPDKVPSNGGSDQKLSASHKKVKSFALIMYQRQQSMYIRN